MRHLKKGNHLGRNPAHRGATLRNMVSSLFLHESITTTSAKAKEAQRLAEKLISLGKKGDLHSRRIALRTLPHKPIVAKLFDDIALRYGERKGGYTRRIKLGFRPGDGASLSLLQLVQEGTERGEAERPPGKTEGK